MNLYLSHTDGSVGVHDQIVGKHLIKELKSLAGVQFMPLFDTCQAFL